MCRLLAIETIQTQRSTAVSPKEILHQFADACQSDNWNTPDGSKQKDGWGLYAVAPDYLGALKHFYHLAEQLNHSNETQLHFQFDGDVWRVLYLSIHEIWNDLEAHLLAQELPPLSQLLVHARAALKGEGLSKNQPYLTKKMAFATNISFSKLLDVDWKKRLRATYPAWRINTTHIGAERIFHLLNAAVEKEGSMERALETINQLLAEDSKLQGMNIVTLTDQGIVALCGSHTEVPKNVAEYYTLYEGRTLDQSLRVVSSAPFGDHELTPMPSGKIISSKP